jgi:hypothetical protein
MRHRFAHRPAVSPHVLFEELWNAVENGHFDLARELVDTLVRLLQDNQSLAPAAVTELVRVAVRRQCPPSMIDALTRLPGFQPGTSLLFPPPR